MTPRQPSSSESPLDLAKAHNVLSPDAGIYCKLVGDTSAWHELLAKVLLTYYSKYIQIVLFILILLVSCTAVVVFVIFSFRMFSLLILTSPPNVFLKVPFHSGLPVLPGFRQA